MKRRDVLATGAVLAALAGRASAQTVPVAALERIAFASCCDQRLPQPIWETVLAARPQLFLFGGDNVYASKQPWSLEQLEEAYATLARVPSFARLRDSLSHMAIWDDHDYGMNDAGAEFAHKADAKAAFLRFWRAGASDERIAREGLYQSRIFGPPGRRVQVIVPDVRWFRSPWKRTDEFGAPGKERWVPDADPAKTMLGEVQWRWLEEQLRQPAELRLLYSSIQVLAEGHGWERWGNLPLERERLVRLIAQVRANGVIFLSGDRHIGALYRETAGTPYPFYEMTSSGLTHPWVSAVEPGPNRIGELFTGQHFGTVDIDWPGRQVQLALRDVQGAVQRSQLVRLDDMKAS